MRRWPLILLLSLLVSATTTLCQAQEKAHRFVAAMEAYKSGDFPAAIAKMEDIAQEGVHNGALYYNLGNAHLKNNDLGRAILWYERALKLRPNDPDLGFNYKYARSLTKDVTEEETGSIVRIFFFWKFKLSNRTTIFSALGFNLLFWCLLLTWRLTLNRGFRNAAAAALVPAVIFILTAAFNYYEADHQRHGIVLTDKISIRSGLQKNSTELFILHAGAKVKVVSKMKDHLKIRFSEDKIGWVESGVVGLI